MLRRRETIAVALGGALGALLRAGLVELFPARAGHWPWVTFAVNLVGSALLGFVSAEDPAGWRRPLIGTGFCGALTTFSAFQLELLGMLDAGSDLLALGYGAASVVAGLTGVLGARALASPPEGAAA